MEKPFKEKSFKHKTDLPFFPLKQNEKGSLPIPYTPDTPNHRPKQASTSISRPANSKLTIPPQVNVPLNQRRVIPGNSSSSSLLQSLIWMQRGISLITVLLVATALGLYGQSVYYERQWGQLYQQLQRLQTLEQQGTTANEIMKYVLIQQSEAPTSAMSTPLPGTAIVLEKAPPREPIQTPNQAPSPLLLEDDNGLTGY